MSDAKQSSTAENVAKPPGERQIGGLRTRHLISTASDLPSEVRWEEGMLLAPQHFQQQSRRQDAQQHYRASLTHPFLWGIRHLKLDTVRLVDGDFQVLELEGIMPDGLVVSHPTDHSGDLIVDLRPYAEAMVDRPMTVHLAVARRRHGQPMKMGDLARYRTLPDVSIADEHGSGVSKVPLLEPRLQLFLGDDPPQKLVTFPLAKISYADEMFALTPYLPPMLQVRPSSELGEICALAATRLREKAVFLADQVMAPSTSAREPQLLEAQSRIHGLVAAVPDLEALLYSRVAHPFDLHRALCRVAGQVASVGRTLVPPVFQPFDQNDPRAGFERIAAFIHRSLDEGVVESYAGFPFEYTDDAFSVAFDPDWLGRNLVLGVTVRRGAAEDGVEQWVDNAVIASTSRMASVRQKRVVGIERRRAEAVNDLIPGRGVMLFTLARDSDLIVPGESLIIRSLDDQSGKRRPSQITLYVRNPDGKQGIGS